MIPGSNILVVDDSVTNRLLLASLLGAEGYEVAQATSGEEALLAVRARTPDLILLDIRMAGLDGLEVCRRLKAQPGSRDIPIMFISAASEGADRVAALELGAIDFVSKPIQRDELRARVRTHLELRRLRTQAERQALELQRANARLKEELNEREAIDRALEASLKEKESLLKEVHHRVKNNLALIISIMRLEAGRSAQAETATVLKEMQARIRSVVLLNEALYKTESYSRVRLADYLSQIATHVFQAQNARVGAVRLVMDVEPVEVETKQAIPCGLIVNELMTNSLKHAFSDGRAGEIRVTLRRIADRTVRLKVSDSGPGLPGDYAERQTHSLGMQLVSDLARQLLGTLAVGPGAAFSIEFPA